MADVGRDTETKTEGDDVDIIDQLRERPGTPEIAPVGNLVGICNLTPPMTWEGLWFQDIDGRRSQYQQLSSPTQFIDYQNFYMNLVQRIIRIIIGIIIINDGFSYSLKTQFHKT